MWIISLEILYPLFFKYNINDLNVLYEYILTATIMNIYFSRTRFAIINCNKITIQSNVDYVVFVTEP